jgi:hypothetical protein
MLGALRLLATLSGFIVWLMWLAGATGLAEFALTFEVHL